MKNEVVFVGTKKYAYIWQTFLSEKIPKQLFYQLSRENIMKKYGIRFFATLIAIAFVFCGITSCSDDENPVTDPVEWTVNENNGSITVDFLNGQYYNNLSLTVAASGGSIALEASNCPSIEMTGFRVSGKYTYQEEDENGKLVTKTAEVENMYVSPKDYEENKPENQAVVLAHKLCASYTSAGNKLSFDFGVLETGASGTIIALTRVDKQLSKIEIVRK